MCLCQQRLGIFPGYFPIKIERKKSQRHTSSALLIATKKRTEHEHDPNATNANDNYPPPPPLSTVNDTVSSAMGRERNSRFLGPPQNDTAARVRLHLARGKADLPADMLPNQLGRIAAVTLDRGRYLCLRRCAISSYRRPRPPRERCDRGCLESLRRCREVGRRRSSVTRGL